MKSAKTVLWLGLMIGTLAALPANAVLISVSPASQNASIGDTVTANIVVSDLAEADSVGGVSLLLSFDDSILQGLSYLVNPAGAMGLEFDLSGGFGLGGSSALDLFFLADGGLGHAGLKALQGSSFVAATVSFTAIANGLSGLNLSVVEPGGAFLSDALGFELVTASANGSVCVGGEGNCAVQVPEPGLLSLLGAGLIAMAATRRRRQGIQRA